MNAAKSKHPDLFLCIPVVILLGFGMVMVYSTSGAQSFDIYGDTSVIFKKQLVALIAGFFAMFATIMIPHSIYKKKPLLLLGLVISVGLLIGVIFQEATKGAHRWYFIGNFGFQPSDVAKLILIVYVAAVASSFQNSAKQWKQRLTAIVPVLVIFCGLILLQPDFGTTMIILGIVGIMLYLAGLPMKLLMLGGLFVLPLMAGILVTKNYRIQRIQNFFTEEHYQTRQAKIAIGSGGLTGVGLAKGKQKLHYLPEPHTDFIFATLCEELGFMGAVTVLCCYLFFLIRGVFVLRKVEALYSQLLGAGLLLLITLQALINISVTLGLFPNKGLTLPFMSAGGTSLLLSMTMFGVILNISRSQVMENRAAA